MSVIRADVAIVGAGYAGMALALALAREAHGALRVVLIERAPHRVFTRGPDVRGVALAATSIRMLRALNVWDAIAAEAQAITRIEISDSAATDVLRRTQLTFEPVAGDESMIVPDGALIAALTTAVGAAPGVTRLDGAAIAAINRDDAIARIELAGGGAIHAPLVVGADGRPSAVRQMAGIGTVARDAHQMGLVAVVTHSAPHDGVATQHFLPMGPLALLPMTRTAAGKNRSCITWSLEPTTAQRLAASDDATVIAELTAAHGGRLGDIIAIGPRAVWPLERHLARELAVNRVALIGDAAHTVHPIAGQGLNIGLADVAVLTDVIMDAARTGLDIGHAPVLDSYARWRRPETTRAAVTFDLLNAAFSTPSGLARSARGVGLALIDRLGGVKSWLALEAAGLNQHLPRLMQG